MEPAHTLRSRTGLGSQGSDRQQTKAILWRTKSTVSKVWTAPVCGRRWMWPRLPEDVG